MLWRALIAFGWGCTRQMTQQFENEGCNNCPELDLADWVDWTTPDYEGFVAIMQPTDSWVAKWQRATTCCPGVYAKGLKKLPAGAYGGAVEDDDDYDEDADDLID